MEFVDRAQVISAIELGAQGRSVEIAAADVENETTERIEHALRERNPHSGMDDIGKHGKIRPQEGIGLLGGERKAQMVSWLKDMPPANRFLARWTAIRLRGKFTVGAFFERLEEVDSGLAGEKGLRRIDHDNSGLAIPERAMKGR
ncbi:hypothetical protein BN873_830003 [Candidatus Competibacter denitrificans Run_A_D11]|uniref:Uncharacterized protein n=1 Tax=Candidatus Competibacter denitrificans Run_A_D11 TaxID=1400863 RepID=W6M937_9GAMM|nr:hypothetical protein BN873_830003 [Candidatus Competibacter denitrificans Run_A_D11]